MPQALRILIVEDDPIVVEDLRQMAEELGHVVCGSAVTADEAIRQAEACAPDLAFVDFNLEGTKTGLNAAARMQTARPLSIVFVTGQSDELVLDAIAGSEPFEVLLKPYTEKQVAAVLHRAAAARGPGMSGVPGDQAPA